MKLPPFHAIKETEGELKEPMNQNLLRLFYLNDMKKHVVPLSSYLKFALSWGQGNELSRSGFGGRNAGRNAGYH